MKRTSTGICRICESLFHRMRPLQVVCGPVCAHKQSMVLAAKKKHESAKADRADTAAKKLAAKPRAQWLSEAQAAFNTYIRKRDANKPCISCGATLRKSWDAGHYRSVGAMPMLRFNLHNVHKQCVPCNQHKSGNAIEYRIGLVKRIGPALVEWLEGPHKAAKYTIDDIAAIKSFYKAKTKHLQELA